MQHTDKVGILPGEQIKLTLVQSVTIAANYTASGNTPFCNKNVAEVGSRPLILRDKNKHHPRGMVFVFMAQEEGYSPVAKIFRSATGELGLTAVRSRSRKNNS